MSESETDNYLRQQALLCGYAILYAAYRRTAIYQEISQWTIELAPYLNGEQIKELIAATERAEKLACLMRDSASNEKESEEYQVCIDAWQQLGALLAQGDFEQFEIDENSRLQFYATSAALRYVLDQQEHDHPLFGPESEKEVEDLIEALIASAERCSSFDVQHLINDLQRHRERAENFALTDYYHLEWARLLERCQQLQQDKTEQEIA